MSKKRTLRVLCGSLLFLILVPGMVVGLIPYWLTGWRIEKPFLGVSFLRIAGTFLVFCGGASLIDSFGRFVFIGLGTPAFMAPPKRLVISGQYRYVRNPMYIAIIVIMSGQSLILGSNILFQYAAFLWLLFHIFVTLYEEPKLDRQYGKSYHKYLQNVRRWLPRFRPWNTQSESKEGDYLENS